MHFQDANFIVPRGPRPCTSTVHLRSAIFIGPLGAKNMHFAMPASLPDIDLENAPLLC